ncbi:MAG: transposase zinc-binding domain-containing protein, partial [Phycisphaerae bacterium]
MPCVTAKSATVYRPRQPLESDFHRLVREHFDTFHAVYAERYARKFGHWRPVYDKAVRYFLKCGDLQHGFARVRCPDCRHEFFVAFSCKQRCICPSCSQKRTLLFGMHVADDVCLNVPHRQFVWTVPKRLRIFFRYHRDLLQQLPALAWQSILQTCRALLGEDAVPGGVLAIQTFGSLMHFHPHIHGLVTDGAFTPDGCFHPIPVNLTDAPFRRIWEDNVFRLLLDAGRIDHTVVSQIRSWRHSGFSVDRFVRIPAGDRDGLERLAQYMARSPFSLTRLLRITKTGQVIYHAEKHRPHRFPDPAADDLFGGVARNYQVFDPLDFLAELTQHIP